MKEEKKEKKENKKAYKLIENPVFVGDIEISKDGTKLKESKELKAAIRDGLVEWR